MPRQASPNHTLNFAYGSNMNTSQLLARCRTAELVGTGVLSDWRFRINNRGYATIVQQPGAVVHGVLWRLSPVDEEALDAYEAVDRAFYTKATLEITTSVGVTTAMVYVASDTTIGKPRPGYLEKILEGAREARFPTAYIAELATWQIPKR